MYINGQSMTLIDAVLNNVLANDKAAPTTSIAISGSASPLTVTLAANETAEIRYTTNGSTPTATSTLYKTPLSLAYGTKLSFFAADLAGNHEAIRTVTIQGSGDTEPPLFSSFTAPLNSSQQLGRKLPGRHDNGQVRYRHLHQSPPRPGLVQPPMKR